MKMSLSFFGLFLSLVANPALASSQAHPHYDLQMSSRDYQRELQKRGAWSILSQSPLDPVLAIGQRNLQWLDYMNSFRDQAHKIHLTKPGSLVGIPIDAPIKYSENSVLKSYNDLQNSMPAEMVKVLFQAGSFTQDPPVAEDVYIQWAHKLDKVYQMGSRWLLVQPYLGWLTSNKAMDVRGTYFLERETNLQAELAGWDQLPSDKQTQLRDWLTQLCYNNKGLNVGCEAEVSQAEKDHVLATFFKSYESSGKDMWNAFFQIPAGRTDVHWVRTSSSQMLVPFLTPDSSAILNFLKDNIQDEWKNTTWNLKLDFHASTEAGIIVANIPHVEFQPGVTPHVNTVAGNIITMDKNAPLDEWDVQWIIRHEFGHVLGFLDCYLEIYDPQTQEVTSYQFDVTNLMCSRQGHFQQQHFDVLQKTYAQ